jgi:hypothetical protein
MSVVVGRCTRRQQSRRWQMQASRSGKKCCCWSRRVDVARMLSSANLYVFSEKTVIVVWAGYAVERVLCLSSNYLFGALGTCTFLCAAVRRCSATRSKVLVCSSAGSRRTVTVHQTTGSVSNWSGGVRVQALVRHQCGPTIVFRKSAAVLKGVIALGHRACSRASIASLQCCEPICICSAL